MKVQTHPLGNVMVLVAHGPLLSDELGELRAAVESTATSSAGGTGAACRGIVVDLSDVPYLDSAGIELLLELAAVTQTVGGETSQHTGVRPKLASLSETCLEALELTNVLPRLDVFDTVENAVRSCQ